MSMKHWLWIALSAAALGCETTSSVSRLTEIEQAKPSGAWTLEAFELSGGQVIPVADRGSYTLELADAERLHLRADCNVCNGGYTLSGSTFEVGLLACTLAACPPGSLETDYLRALESASAIEIGDDFLRIVYGGGVLHFSRP